MFVQRQRATGRRKWLMSSLGSRVYKTSDALPGYAISQLMVGCDIGFDIRTRNSLETSLWQSLVRQPSKGRGERGA